MTTLKLAHPITLGRKTVEELTFRDYTTAADYLSFDTRGGVAQNIAMIASLSGTDEALVRQLRGPDYLAAVGLFEKILRDDQVFSEAGDDAEKKPAAS
ncbi:MAG: phage tail assembly protein [Azoarcus sp.]|jgi:hypothetical protein|nr:phage tail assembly protein [Azoarcus sp.]